MSVKESSATALIRFTGLGIVCFSKERRRGEIAVIRDNKHLLSVSIQRPVFQEGSGNDDVVYQDIASYKDLPKDSVEIEIAAAGKSAVPGYEIYQRGEFDRLDSPDANDFRWIVNMSELHGDAALAKTEQGSYPLTKISIANGLYYTHKLDTRLFFERVEKNGNGATKREVFGNVGETVGVKIDGDEVKLTIRVDGKEEIHTLNRVEGLPFKIEIKNMDYNEDAVYSDMADYYTYVASPNGTLFDLAPIIEDDGKAEGGGVNQKQFCHPVVVEDPPGI
jgi:hypothetical protein